MSQVDRSSDQPQIAVGTNIIPNDSFDCGILGLRWCRGQSCLQRAKLINFVLTLCFAGIFLGACSSYFRISATILAAEYSWNPLLVEWLIVCNSIFQILFAIFYTYWALKIHPTSWLGGTLMLQSAVCVIAIIPSIVNFSEGLTTIWTQPAPDLCLTAIMSSQKAMSLSPGFKWGQLVLMIFLQLMLGLAVLSYITVGINYIDDNSSSGDSPVAIAAVLAALAIGHQVGVAIIMTLYELHLKWWLGWLFLALAVFIKGLIISLFPKRLPKTVVHQTAERIVEDSRSRQFGSTISTYMDDTNLFPTLKRLFTNKLLMLNILSLMCLMAGYVNFTGQETNYLQSRFFVGLSEHEGWLQMMKTRYIAYFLRSPAMAVGILLSGLLISKFQFSAQRMTGFGIGFSVQIVFTYIGFIFITCYTGPIAGVANGHFLQPYCSNQCICSSASFKPVCPLNSNLTYFSPCYAGCTNSTTINNVNIYEGCSCASSFDYKLPKSVRATDGACNSSFCSIKLVIFQMGVLSITFVTGIIIVIKILIAIRSVLPQDKGLALALGLTIIGFFTYVPTKVIYDIVTKFSCSVWGNDSTCLLLDSPKHGNILDIVTAVLTLFAVFLDIAVAIWSKDLNMYSVKARDRNMSPSLYTLVPPEDNAQAQTTTVESSSNTPAVGSVVSPTLAAKSPITATLRPLRPPKSAKINVYRSPSSTTNASSTSDQSDKANHTGVDYAHILFPADKQKGEDGSVSPKRLVVRADVPLNHLTANDVRSQLQNLKSFQKPEIKSNNERPQSPETNF